MLRAVSFMKRAQEAAEAAKAKVEEAATAASRTAADPTTTERINKSLSGAGQGAREAVGLARRGVNTVIERIDPGTLAELIVKATALQEMTNTALRAKRSPYRISEISISASIPPGVTFAIGRIDDVDEEIVGEIHESADLLEAASGAGEVVIALDGATIDQETAAAIAEAAAVPAAPGAIDHRARRPGTLSPTGPSASPQVARDDGRDDRAGSARRSLARPLVPCNARRTEADAGRPERPSRHPVQRPPARRRCPRPPLEALDEPALDLLDGTRAALAGRPLRDLDAAGGQGPG
jgi:hypothetical protein